MDAEIKSKWLAALRSGEYKQTKDVLCQLVEDKGTHAGHCCLGVLCEVMGLASEVADDGKWFLDEGGSAKNRIYMPTNASNRAGIRQSEGELMGMNDAGKPFAEIADWIEQNL